MQALDSTPLSFFHLCSIDLVMILNKHVFLMALLPLLFGGVYIIQYWPFPLQQQQEKKRFKRTRMIFWFFHNIVKHPNQTFYFLKILKMAKRKLKKASYAIHLIMEVRDLVTFLIDVTKSILEEMYHLLSGLKNWM